MNRVAISGLAAGMVLAVAAYIPISLQAKAAGKPDAVAPIVAAKAAQPDPQSIGTLKIFLDQGAAVNYLGRLYGLDGWLVTKGAAAQVVYTTLDGQGTVVGVLYGPGGEAETSNQLADAEKNGIDVDKLTGKSGQSTPGAAPAAGAAPQSPMAKIAQASNQAAAGTAAAFAAQAAAAAGGAPVQATAAPPGQGSPSERLWADVSGSTYFSVGAKTAPVLYVFMDPRCHYCQNYWQELNSSYVAQNAVQVRVIPVGILGPESEKEAQQLMSSADMPAAWAKLEANDPLALPQTIAGDAAAKVKANVALMVRWKAFGTPFSVYRGKDGKVKVVSGVPDNVGQVVADLGK